MLPYMQVNIYKKDKASLETSLESVVLFAGQRMWPTGPMAHGGPGVSEDE
jgi:hypothetical protein